MLAERLRSPGLGRGARQARARPAHLDEPRRSCRAGKLCPHHGGDVSRRVRDGDVIGTCRPLHLGRSTHVWDIRVETPDGKLVSVIRLTNAIVRKPG